MFRQSRKVLALLLCLLLLVPSATMAYAITEDTKNQADHDPMVNVIVQLKDDPVLQKEVELKEQDKYSISILSNYEMKLATNRNDVMAKAVNHGIELNQKYSYTHAFNGFSAEVPLSQVRELEQLDGVKAVFPDTIIEVPQLFDTVGDTNAPYLWDLPEGVTGEGMVIAVLDTGIDYNHPDLGGGVGEDYKVKGGRNFTGIIRPNPQDFMDRQGHGTHVAGISAANGEIKGVAPGADLYAVKVLGDSGFGQTSWTLAGIEWAVNPTGDLPRADVINMSLGASVLSPYFPTSLAANTAAEAGILVVAAAGNDGQDSPTVGSPSTGDKVFSVGSYGLQSVGTIELSNGNMYYDDVMPADAPESDGEEYELVYAGLARAEDFDDLDVEDKIVIAQRGEIAFDEKGLNAYKNGAKGIIVFNNEPGPFGMMGDFHIPAFAIPQQMGEEIIELMEQNPGLKAKLNMLEPMDLMSSFSSAGPTSTYSLKPDITAPGDAIYSTIPGGGYDTFGGTSMAAPHVAGGLALMKQYRPELTVGEHKALLMNTAWHLDNIHGEKYPVTTQGAGIMDLEAAAKSRGIALPGSLSLNLEGETNTIRVRNISDEAITYDVEFISDTMEATTVDTITVEANSDQEFEITFDLDLPKGHHEGFVVLTPTQPLEEDYYDILQVTVYYNNGPIEEFFASDIEFSPQVIAGEDLDISFTLTQNTTSVEVSVLNNRGGFVKTLATAPNGLPAGRWTMYNTELGLAPGSYLLNLVATNEDGERFELYKPLEVGAQPVLNVDYDLYVSTDKYTIKGSTDVEAEVFINDVQANKLENNEFELEVDLEPGENAFEVVAISEDGIAVSKEIVITRLEAIAYSIDQLASNDVTVAEESIILYEKASPGTVLTIRINDGEEIVATANDDGLIMVPLLLAEGVNNIRITKSHNNQLHNYDVQIFRKYVGRLAGTDRFETAVEISKKGWERSDTVIIARGDDFADSLSGVPLSHKLDAPILLSRQDELPVATMEEIQRLEAKEIIILGGYRALSDTVREQLEDEGLAVRRIGGKDRLETSLLIAEEVVAGRENVDSVVITYGYDFPDGLTVAPLAAELEAPILLVKSDEVSEELLKFLEEYNVNKTKVIGGDAVISDNVLEELPTPERIAGKNRYETSVEVAKLIDSETIYITSGMSFADSLTASALAAKKGGKVLLVRPDAVPAVIEEHIESVKGDVNQIYIAGGNAAIDQSVEITLQNLLK